jgi:hypothetical protein
MAMVGARRGWALVIPLRLATLHTRPTNKNHTLAPVFHLPEATMPLVTWIGVIGFPFAVVFSWVYELTPEGLKRDSEAGPGHSTAHLTGKRLDYALIALRVTAMLARSRHLQPGGQVVGVHGQTSFGSRQVALEILLQVFGCAARLEPIHACAVPVGDL